MRRFTLHSERWGDFVDVKINAAELLTKQLRRNLTGSVILSSVTDPYQEAERTFAITRACLEILSISILHVDILTKSDLILRDLDILRRMPSLEVGFTVTTDSPAIKEIFEPHSPPIRSRLEAARTLKANHIRTYIFIGPVLPMNPENLAELVAPCAHRVLIDRMNYPRKVASIYRMHGIEYALTDQYYEETKDRLRQSLQRLGIECSIVT